MRAPHDLYLDASGNLVPEDHPEVAELLAAKGQPVPAKRLDRSPGLRDAIEQAEEKAVADRKQAREAKAEEEPAEPQTVQEAIPPPVSEGDRPGRRR